LMVRAADLGEELEEECNGRQAHQPSP
jgi:hypothetical protein